jgi:hypothetical protein
MLQVPTPNSNLNLFTFTFHYINPTNAQQMRFSPVNKTVCPLECAALSSLSLRFSPFFFALFSASFPSFFGAQLNNSASTT